MTAQALAEHLAHAARRMPSTQAQSDVVDGRFALDRFRDDEARDFDHEALAVLVLPIERLDAAPTVFVVVDHEDGLQHGVFGTRDAAERTVALLGTQNSTASFDIEEEPLRFDVDPILADA